MKDGKIQLKMQADEAKAALRLRVTVDKPMSAFRGWFFVVAGRGLK
jgi:hypothetical protein